MYGTVCVSAVEKAVLLASESSLSGGSILRKGTIQQAVAKQALVESKDGPIVAQIDVCNCSRNEYNSESARHDDVSEITVRVPLKPAPLGANQSAVADVIAIEAAAVEETEEAPVAIVRTLRSDLAGRGKDQVVMVVVVEGGDMAVEEEGAIAVAVAVVVPEKEEVAVNQAETTERGIMPIPRCLLLRHHPLLLLLLLRLL